MEIALLASSSYLSTKIDTSGMSSILFLHYFDSIVLPSQSIIYSSLTEENYE